MRVFLVLAYIAHVVAQNVTIQHPCCTKYCGNNLQNPNWLGAAIPLALQPASASSLLWLFNLYDVANLTSLNGTIVYAVPGDIMIIANNAGQEGTSAMSAFKITIFAYPTPATALPFWLTPLPIPLSLQTANRQLNPGAGFYPITGNQWQVEMLNSGSFLVQVDGYTSPQGNTYWNGTNPQTPNISVTFTIQTSVPPSPSITIILGTFNWTTNIVGTTVVKETIAGINGPTIHIPMNAVVYWDNPSALLHSINKLIGDPRMTAKWNVAGVNPGVNLTTEALQLTAAGKVYFAQALVWVLYEEVLPCSGTVYPPNCNSSAYSPLYTLVVDYPFIGNRTGGFWVDDNPACVPPPPPPAPIIHNSASSSGSNASYEPIPLTISIVGIALPMVILYCVVPCVYICCKNKTKL